MALIRRALTRLDRQYGRRSLRRTFLDAPVDESDPFSSTFTSTF